MSDVKAVFFDFGDTLATLVPSKEELFIRAARSLGMELELEAVKRAYQIVDFHNKYSYLHVHDREAFYYNYNQQLAEALGISSLFSGLNPALIAQFRNDKKWELFAEVPDALAHPKLHHLPLALVANWDSNLSSLTEQLGIRQTFSAIVPSQTAGVEKPDAAIFELAAAELSLSVKSDRILYLGNEYRADVVGARAAGLIPVLIDRGHLYPHADCVRFTSLLEWLENMA
ncbi:MAG TPA: HAD family hydrolase [Pyrinomonadaceae bacterium]